MINNLEDLIKSEEAALQAELATPTTYQPGEVNIVHTAEGWHVEIEGTQLGTVFPEISFAHKWLDTLVKVGHIKETPFPLLYIDRRPWREAHRRES